MAVQNKSKPRLKQITSDNEERAIESLQRLPHCPWSICLCGASIIAEPSVVRSGGFKFCSEFIITSWLGISCSGFTHLVFFLITFFCFSFRQLVTASKITELSISKPHVFPNAYSRQNFIKQLSQIVVFKPHL